LDGKVPQALQHSGEAQRPVAIISGVVVRGTATNDVSPEEADASDTCPRPSIDILELKLSNK
jgi:hypothetical protein